MRVDGLKLGGRSQLLRSWSVQRRVIWALVLREMLTPRWAVMGDLLVKASPYRPHETTAGPNGCPHCGRTPGR